MILPEVFFEVQYWCYQWRYCNVIQFNFFVVLCDTILHCASFRTFCAGFSLPKATAFVRRWRMAEACALTCKWHTGTILIWYHLRCFDIFTDVYRWHHRVVQRMKHVAWWASLLAFNVLLKSSARWDRLADLLNKSVKHKSNVARAEPSTLHTMPLFAMAKPFVSRTVALRHLQEKQKTENLCVLAYVWKAHSVRCCWKRWHYEAARVIG